MPEAVVSVFVSSTWIDLQPERASIEEVLHRFRETKFVGMEYFGSRDEDAATASVDEVERCQLFIAVVGGRYGSGIVETEYRKALDGRIPCLIYLKEKDKIAPQFEESDPSNDHRLASMLNLMRRMHKVEAFLDASALALKAAADLHRWLFDQYLTPLLQDALSGEYPKAEAHALIRAVKDLTALSRELTDRLAEARYLSTEASRPPLVVLTGNSPQIFIGNYQRLSDAYIDPQRVFQRVKLDQFVGRSWLIDEFDKFVAKEKPGYFILEAAAGLGKTTLLAWLSQTRGYVHHFCEMASGLEGVAPALRSINAQLISCYQLADSESASVLPPGAERPDFLLRTLKRASEHRRVGETIVIVVDALDEAGTPLGQNVLGLPAELPSGVCFIVSMRPVPVTLDVDPTTTEKVIFRQLTADDPNNRADMELFLKGTTEWRGVRKALFANGYTAVQFVQTLTQKCGGVWIYLHYVVHEIENGDRTPLDLESLPDGMSQYYVRYWGQWRNSDEEGWYGFYLPVLATLAAAREPVRIQRLLDWSGVSLSVKKLRRLLNERWRPFLAIAGPSQDSSYRIYHATLREFFEGLVDRAVLREVECVFIDELMLATRAAHSGIADRFLAAWGGLNRGLSELPSTDCESEGFSYGVRHLAAHLDLAGRSDDLHVLLGLETPERTNLWFKLKELVRDSEGFASDVTRAWRALRGTVRSLNFEIKYALTIASLNEVASNIPPVLLSTLVKRNLITQIDGIMYARQIPNPAQRASTMLAIAGSVDEPQRTGLIEEVLGIIGTSSLRRTNEQAIADFAGSLAALGRTAEAFECAGVLRDPGHLSGSLVDIASELLEIKDNQNAFRAAKLIPDDEIREWTLLALARRWAVSGQATSALNAALALDIEERRAELLMDLIPYFSGPELDYLFSTLLKFRSPLNKAKLLSRLVTRFVEIGKHQAARLATSCLETACQGLHRDLTILLLAPTLFAIGQADAAIAMVMRRAPAPVRDAALARMCMACQTEEQCEVLLHALATCPPFEKVSDKIGVMLGLEPWMSLADGYETVAKACELAAGAQDSHELLDWLTMIVRQASKPGRHELLEKATRIALNIPEAFVRSSLLSKWPYISGAAWDRLLTFEAVGGYQRLGALPLLSAEKAADEAEGALENLRGSWAEKADVALALAPYLKRPLPTNKAYAAKLIDLFKVVGSADPRAIVSLELAPGLRLCRTKRLFAQLFDALGAWIPAELLPPMQSALQKVSWGDREGPKWIIASHAPRASLSQALEEAREIGDHSARIETQVEFADHLGNERLSELLRMVKELFKKGIIEPADSLLRTTRRDVAEELIKIAGSWDGALLFLLPLARFASPAVVEKLYERAAGLLTAEQIRPLIPHLGKELSRRLIRDFVVNDNPAGQQGRNVAGRYWELLPFLQPEAALSEILQSSATDLKPEALLAIAKNTYETQSFALAEAARSVGPDDKKCELLAIAASKTTGHVRIQLCREALSAARAVVNGLKRAELLLKVAAQLETPDSESIAREALYSCQEGPEDLAQGLILSATQYLPKAECAAIFQKLTARSRSLVNAGDFVSLIKLIAAVPAEHRRDITLDALAVVRRVGDEVERGDALARLAKYLPEELIAGVIVEASSFQDQARAETFEKLIPDLPVGFLPAAAAAVRSVGDKEARRHALSAVASQCARLPRQELQIIWHETLVALSTRSRSDLLSDLGALSSVILALDPERGADAVFDAVTDVGRWWR